MYVDDSKIFVKKEKELESLIQNIITYGQDIGMSCVTEKYLMLIMKMGKTMERLEVENQESVRILGEKEIYD